MDADDARSAGRFLRAVGSTRIQQSNRSPIAGICLIWTLALVCTKKCSSDLSCQCRTLWSHVAASNFRMSNRHRIQPTDSRFESHYFAQPRPCRSSHMWVHLFLYRWRPYQLSWPANYCRRGEKNEPSWTASKSGWNGAKILASKCPALSSAPFSLSRYSESNREERCLLAKSG